MTGIARSPLAARIRRRLSRDIARLRRLPPERELAGLERFAGAGALRVAARHLESGRTIGVHANAPAPMASTVKVALAVEVLAQVDAGRLALDEIVAIEPRHLRPGHGIITPHLGADGVALSLRTLLRLTMVESDNTATDLLFARVGGPGVVAARLHALGIYGISVDRTTLQLMTDRRAPGGGGIAGSSFDLPSWRAAMKRVSAGERAEATQRFLSDRRDTATPGAMVQLLAAIYEGHALPPTRSAELLALMTDCATGAGRIRAGVPAGARVAHKTGTLPAVVSADAGIVSLPHGRGHVALAVFVVGAGTSAERQDRIIAECARCVCDHLSR